MSRTVIALLVFAIPISAAGLYCEETFDYDDGTLPVGFVITGDSGEPGAFAVLSGAFTHSETGVAHYAWLTCDGPPPDLFHFEVQDGYWDFAWRITWDPSSGRCLRLSHDDNSGQWAYSFSEFSWWSLDPSVCPDCQWMWHNGTALRTVLHHTEGPAEGWHSVQIFDNPYQHYVRIRVDGELIFEETYEDIYGNIHGFGCSGGSVGSPAFDNVWFEWDDPVEAATWGAVKALYRLP